MKSIILFLFMFFLISCTNKRVNESPIDYSLYKQVYTISYGDDRFHQCEELVDVQFGITFNNDTVELKTIQRNCTEWQKKNYDIHDGRARYPHQPAP